MKFKKRLDLYLKENYIGFSKNQIQNFIKKGKVKVNNKIELKPGLLISELDYIETDIEKPKYVSRAGYKLEYALNHFNINVKDKIALDSGISTGGFSDCLIQHGTKKIYGIDVGTNQLHNSLRNNPKIVLFENTNLRYFNFSLIKDEIDIVTLDLSFISVLKVINIIYNILKESGQLIILVKPQFEFLELPKDDKIIYEDIKNNFLPKIENCGFKLLGFVESIIEVKNNKEFLAYFKKIVPVAQ